MNVFNYKTFIDMLSSIIARMRSDESLGTAYTDVLQFFTTHICQYLEHELEHERYSDSEMCVLAALVRFRCY